MNNQALLLFVFKIVSIICGLIVIFLGYRLFVKGIFNEAGDLEGTWMNKTILLKKAAPGTFFALFGAIVMAFSVFKGLNFESEAKNTPIVESSVSPPVLLDTLTLNTLDSAKSK